MIVHNVAFKMAAEDAATRAEHAAELARRLRALDGQVPGLVSLMVATDLGKIDTHYELVLVSTHATYEDLESYQAHPLHREVIDYGNTVVAQRACVDYEA